MARYRRNPDLFGEDLVPLAWQAAGLGGTAYVNDKFMQPVVDKMIPSGDAAVGKAVDAATTAVTAWLLGEAIRQVDATVGKLVRRGGMLLAVAKVISIPVPSFSVSAKFPDLPLPWQRSAPVPALPAPSNDVITPQAMSRLGVGSMGI